MCSASASGDTVINKSTLYVQSGLKYNLCGKCPETIHYNTLHRMTRQHQQFVIVAWHFRPNVRRVLAESPAYNPKPNTILDTNPNRANRNHVSTFGRKFPTFSHRMQ